MLTIVQVQRDGLTLDCWLAGGKHFVREPPERPYFYDYDYRGEGEQVQRKLLSHPDVDITIVKRIVSNVYRVRQLRRPDSLEAQVRFTERLAQDFGFKQSDVDASLLAFDIEASSTAGQFPRSDIDHVTAIALVDRGTQVCFTIDDMPEYEILARACEVVSQRDPDVLGTYSGTAFDYDFTIARASVLDVLDSVRWGRLADVPYTRVREYKSGKKIGVDKTTFMSGRIAFDIYKEVRFDPYLSGIRRGLKSVGRFFFGDSMKIIELDRTRLKLASGSELHDYCLSDARLTWMLGEHYLSVLKTCAFVLRVPLDFMVYRSPSHIGNVVYGRDFNELGIVSDGSNVDRFTGILW